MFMCALCERAARIVCLSAFVITLLLIGNVPVFAQGGSLDFSFNSSGHRYDGFPGGTDELRAIAVQPDGKIVAVGRADNIPGSGTDFAIVRYNLDGSLDTTFGDGDGKVITAIGPGGNTDMAYGIAIQADGKILAAGQANGISGSGTDFAIVRYNADGSLDATFDEDGKVTTAGAAGTGSDIAHALILQPDGKIIAVGESDFDFTAVRYNSDGSLDTTFDSDGRVVTPITAAGGASAEIAFAVGLQSDGKIVLAGYAGVTATSGQDFALVRYNTDGSLDSTFDSDGKVTTAIAPGTGSDAAYAVAIQPDGKIVAAGYTGSSTTDFGLVRYNANGSLDTTFDTDGRVITAIGTGSDFANGVAIQPDGKIVAAGRADGFAASGTDFALARYLSNGSLDSTFDGDGRAITALGSGTNADIANAVSVQSDGKIIAAGSVVTTLNSDFGVVRYNSNGSLDTTFDTDGKVTTDIGNANSQDTAVAVQADGKTVIAGYYQNPSTSFDFAVIRYNVDGSLDTTFDGDGKVTTALSVNPDVANAVAIQADGKIIVAGYAPGGSGSPDFALVRYNADGSPDTSFDGDGMVITDVGFTFGNDMINAVTVQSDGKIVAAGSASTGTFWDLAVVRYNADGSLDTTFDGDGRAIVNIGTQNDIAYAVAIQADGKIVAAGVASGAASGGDFGIVRLNSDGSPDTSFDTDGKVTTAIGPTTNYDEARGLIIQADGKIIAAGRADNGFVAGVDFALVRYNADGSPDTTFDTDGVVTTAVGTSNTADIAYAIVQQADGKIVAGGRTGTDMAFGRYNDDGSLDTTFSEDGIATIDLGGNEYVLAMSLYPNNRVALAGYVPNNFLAARVWLDVFATAAKVSVSGRVVDKRGRGVSGVTLTLTDEDGLIRTVISNTSGQYRFRDVEAGQTYTVYAEGKSYTIADPVRMIEVTEHVEDVDFLAEPSAPGGSKPRKPHPVKPSRKGE
jgi:uncharacterized delta-60 repeat protein